MVSGASLRRRGATGTASNGSPDSTQHVAQKQAARLGDEDARDIGHTWAFDATAFLAFRSLLGILVAMHQFEFLLDSEAFFAEDGIFPRTAVIGNVKKGNFGVHLAVGTLIGQQVLLLAGVGSGVAIAAGFHPQLAAFAAWILVRGTVCRAWATTSGGDKLLTIILFWVQFMPMAGLSKNRIVGVGPFLWRCQIILIYWSTTAIRLWPHDSEWRDGTAVAKCLQYELLAIQPQAQWLASRLECAKLAAWGAICVEFFVPLVLMLPLPRICGVAAITMIGFHAILGCFFAMGLFSPTCCLLFVPLLPGCFFPSAMRSWSRPMTASCDNASSHPRMARVARCVSPTLRAIAMCTCFALGFCNVLDNDFGTNLLRGAPEDLAYFIGIDQRWHMFATKFGRTDWLVLDGLLEDDVSRVTLQLGGLSGRGLTVLPGGPSGVEPERLSATFFSDRWRYLTQNWFGIPQLNKDIAQYICKSANKDRVGASRLRGFMFAHRWRAIYPEVARSNLSDIGFQSWLYQCATGTMAPGPKGPQHMNKPAKARVQEKTQRPDRGSSR